MTKCHIMSFSPPLVTEIRLEKLPMRCLSSRMPMRRVLSPIYQKYFLPRHWSKRVRVFKSSLSHPNKKEIILLYVLYQDTGKLCTESWRLGDQNSARVDRKTRDKILA